MKRTVISVAVLSLAVAGVSQAQAGNGSGQGAQKSPLKSVATEPANMECESSETTSEEATVGDATGFAILNAPGRTGAVEKINGQVKLHKAGPNETFGVFLAQGGTCTLTGTLTTNGQGNGTSHIDTVKSGITVPANAGVYYVVLQSMADLQERYASAPVTLQ